MNVRRSWLLSLTCLFLPALGFALTCIGAYLVSLQTTPGLKTVSIYIVIVFGFLAMLIGVIYTLCHSLKSKMYQRRQRERHIQIFTVERWNHQWLLALILLKCLCWNGMKMYFIVLKSSPSKHISKFKSVSRIKSLYLLLPDTLMFLQDNGWEMIAFAFGLKILK